MKQMITPEVVKAVLSKFREVESASIFEGNTQQPFGVQSVTLDLATARLPTNPYEVKFPFISIYVADATDVLANINMAPNSRDSFQSLIPLKKNDSWTRREPLAQAFLSWEAQAGKTLTLLFFVDSEFRSGSQISVSGGGVSINDGSTFTTTRVSLTAATAGAVVSANPSRKIASVQNNTGAQVWFGNSSVSNTGSNLGFKVEAGGVLQWRNTAALYAYSVAGGSGDLGLLVLEEQ